MVTKPVIFQKLSLIGLGLIGSSVARAVRHYGLVGEVVGYDRDQETREKAIALGLLDRVTPTAAAAVAGADCVMLCTPLSTYTELGREIAPILQSGTIVTDVGSVKSCVLRDLSPLLPNGVHLVPGHPIAGTEHSGPEAGFVELFKGRWCVLTPLLETDNEAVKQVVRLWSNMGSMVDLMPAEHHDRVLAITSHLPHLIAYTIVGTATKLAEDLKSEVIKFSASGFRDFTRIAASDPIMWRDISLANREAILEIIRRFVEDLTVLQRAICLGEGSALEERFARTQVIRCSIIEAKQA
jgi:cyclohexadieny/prephenate dehydrogenase